MTTLKARKGTTLIEVLVASAISLVIGLIIAYFFGAWQQTFRRHVVMVDLRNEALKAESIVRDLQRGYQNKQSGWNEPHSYFNTPIAAEIDLQHVPPDNDSSRDYNCGDFRGNPYCGNVISFIGGDSINVPNHPEQSILHVISYYLTNLAEPNNPSKILGLVRQDAVTNLPNREWQTSQQTILGYYHGPRDYLSVVYFLVRRLPIGDPPLDTVVDNRSYTLDFSLRVKDASGRRFPEKKNENEKDLLEFSGNPRVSPPPD